MSYEKETRKVISRWDGLELDLLVLVPEETPKGIFQIHHGMSEYKERYLPFMEYLTEAGYVTAIHDCRGHGKSVKSEKDYGYMYGADADVLVDDAHQVTEYLKERWPGIPVILFGHSMGSMVVRVYTKKYDRDIDMLIVCGSPGKNDGLKAGQAIAWLQGKIMGEKKKSLLLEGLSFGAFAKKFSKEKSKFSWCCANPDVVRAYEESSMCGFPFTVNGYQALFELMEKTYNEKDWAVNHPEIPVLFVAGSDDPCIGGARKFAQAVQLMRRVGYKDTRGKLYPGMRHEILNECGRKKVYVDILRYTEKKLLTGSEKHK